MDTQQLLPHFRGAFHRFMAKRFGLTWQNFFKRTAELRRARSLITRAYEAGYYAGAEAQKKAIGDRK